jgi:hypothetical protein
MLRNELARTKGTIQKALKYSRMGGKKDRHDNNISTVQQAKVACKIHAHALPPRRRAKNGAFTERESNGHKFIYIPGHKVSLSERAVPTAVVRKKEGKQRREK